MGEEANGEAKGDASAAPDTAERRSGGDRRKGDRRSNGDRRSGSISLGGGGGHARRSGFLDHPWWVIGAIAIGFGLGIGVMALTSTKVVAKKSWGSGAAAPESGARAP